MLVLLAAGSLSGCGTSREDLGTVVFTIPKLPGSDDPYPLPPLEGGETAPDEAQPAPENTPAQSDSKSPTAKPAAAEPLPADGPKQ